jgi:sugar transferase EpsL
MVKRILDISISLVALVLTAPVLVAIAIVIRVCLGAPVLFRQKRPGLHGKLFTLYKFRTMTTAVSRTGEALSDEHRVTRVGKLLRATSLDELPELFNVFMGDMSLVGPRPLLPEYLPHYSQRHARRHDVRPGLTGWAQVNGRNLLDWEERFELDLWYVDNQSLILDLQILLRTVSSVFSMRGVNAKDHATMPRYEGIKVAPSALYHYENSDEPENTPCPPNRCANCN